MKGILAFLPIAAFALTVSCTEQEIIHETVVEYIDLEHYDDFGFYRRSDLALVEVTLPDGTAADDAIYIAGPFNGGDVSPVDSRYRLSKSTRMPGRYGVYLDPDEYLDGKAPSDGFWFVSANEGREFDAQGAEAVHKDSVDVATRTLVSVESWRTRFIPLEQWNLYILDRTGWGGVNLYYWGDGYSPLEWPGVYLADDSNTELYGKTWRHYLFRTSDTGKLLTFYFFESPDTPKEQRVRADSFFTVDSDKYVLLTTDSVSEINPED